MFRWKPSSGHDLLAKFKSLSCEMREFAGYVVVRPPGDHPRAKEDSFLINPNGKYSKSQVKSFGCGSFRTNHYPLLTIG